jgi:arylsulfatase A-like enzyme
LEPSRTSGRPFFLFLNYMDAHWPYLPNSPFDARLQGIDRYFNMLKRYDDLARQVNDRQQPMDAADRARLTSQYDGGIAAEDAALGDLLNRLREMQLYDDTIIVIMADHGEALGEHGNLFHGLGMVNESFVHIPLLIKYPGQREGSRSEDLVSQVDLMPTILESVGSTLPAGLQGRSLLLPSAKARALVYSQATLLDADVASAQNPRFQGVRRAIFSGTLKLITWSAGPPEFYDLASDPHEEHNLYQVGDPRIADLSGHLDSWVASAPRQRTNPARPDQSTVERLKSLGYVQ